MAKLFGKGRNRPVESTGPAAWAAVARHARETAFFGYSGPSRERCCRVTNPDDLERETTNDGPIKEPEH